MENEINENLNEKAERRLNLPDRSVNKDFDSGMEMEKPSLNTSDVKAFATEIRLFDEHTTSIPDYTEEIMRAMNQPAEIRDGVKVTDINLCARQKIFNLIKPKEQSRQNTVKTATGTALHIYTQKKMKNPDPERYEAEMLVVYKGYIFGTVDLYDKKFNVVVDIKTKVIENERWQVKPFSAHEEQLKDLMAIKRAAAGVLVYILIGGSMPIMQFNYRLNQEMLQLQLNKLENRATSFLSAKQRKDPRLADHVFFDKGLNWLCHRIDRKTGKGIFCPYYWECFSMIKEEKERKDDTENTQDEDLVHTGNGDGEEDV